MKKNCVIVLAAGSGSRMKKNINKQYILINERPVLYYTLTAFSNCSFIDEIIVVAAKDEIEYCKNEVVKKYNIKKVSKVIEGGEERQNSVLNGLKCIDNCDIVSIHDGARPFVSQNIIEQGIQFAKKYGACACGVKPKDTIKIKDNYNFSKDTLNRDNLLCIQTPQTFKYDIIFNCHKKIEKNKIKVTDDTMVVEKYGHKVYLYDGDYENIKITTPEDLILAKGILDKNKE